jgi:hypothetical protein
MSTGHSSTALSEGQTVLLRSIRSRLIGLVVASVVPFTALIGVGLWNQWRSNHNAAIQRAIESTPDRQQCRRHVGSLNPLGD